MACFVTCLVAAVALQLAVAQNVQDSVDATAIASDSESSLSDSCPSQDRLDIAIKIHPVPDCGDGLWYRVINLPQHE